MLVTVSTGGNSGQPCRVAQGLRAPLSGPHKAPCGSRYSVCSAAVEQAPTRLPLAYALRAALTSSEQGSQRYLFARGNLWACVKGHKPISRGSMAALSFKGGAHATADDATADYATAAHATAAHATCERRPDSLRAYSCAVQHGNHRPKYGPIRSPLGPMS